MVLGLLLYSTAASAQDISHSCTCRANGRDYTQGQVTCIRGIMAKCGMMLNNSSWIMSGKACPLSSRPVILVRLAHPGARPKNCIL